MIRPFQPGDLFLLQRLNRQVTKFPTVQTVLQPHSPLRIALGAMIPWDVPRGATYVLRQEGHGLVHDGFLQTQKRSGAPEVDIVCLAPGLDSPTGHPAIWNKLLSHFLQNLMQNGIERIYANVSDQPLPVNTFAGVGFQVYARQTIWRLFSPDATRCPQLCGSDFRPKSEADNLPLIMLYLRTVPARVQQAEGWVESQNTLPPFLRSWSAEHGLTFVLLSQNVICGAVRITTGRRGSWLEWWADTLTPDESVVSQLFAIGLNLIAENGWATPVYTTVEDYHGGITPILGDLGFAPSSDRVRMVKYVVKWVRETATAPVGVIETTSEVVPSPYAPPDTVHFSAHAHTSLHSNRNRF